ncbi:hypothetical protein KY285_031509 [Solanum tuberosum]|nr:hypothetical protein KY284_031296 [Solanum tuberosum]KAH0656627.1 hypothetical protein KY285_031509 [Solanum tuberosum]
MTFGASKEQQAQFISALYGHVATLLRHMVGSLGKMTCPIAVNLLQKGSVIRHMTSVLQPIMEKGILDHSIIHWALVEHLTIADKVSQKP